MNTDINPTVDLDAVVEANYATMLNYTRRRVPVREDAEDLVQTAMAKAYRALQRGSGPRDPAQAKGWLWQVLRNVIADNYRDAARAPKVVVQSDLLFETYGTREQADQKDFDQRRTAFVDNQIYGYLAYEVDFAEDFDNRCLLGRILNIVGRLTKGQQQAMAYVIDEGLEPNEAAARDGHSYGALKTMMFRARTAIAAQLAADVEAGYTYLRQGA